MKTLPARLESVAKFRARAPDGKVLVPENPAARPYGLTPFAGVDDGAPHSFAVYPLPAGVSPVARVVVVGDQAWLLGLIARRKSFAAGELRFRWTPGQNSIHDTRKIAAGRDVGNVTVTRHGAAGQFDVPYDVTFAFAFRAFMPKGKIHTDSTHRRYAPEARLTGPGRLIIVAPASRPGPRPGVSSEEQSCRIP